MAGNELERPRGLEPPPTAWQAVVLPLYYGRFSQQILYNMQERLSQEPVPMRLADGHTLSRLPTPRSIPDARSGNLTTRVLFTTGDFFCRCANLAAFSRSV